MAEEKKISVIVPVYNVRSYLRQCIDSIISQSYYNLEIILIDDGSTDGSGEICDQYIEDNRVTVIHQKNGGQSAAKNRGLEMASGEFIGFVDSDDWIETDFFELLVKRQEAVESDITVIGFQFVYEGTDEVKKVKIPEITYNYEDAMIALWQENIGHYMCNKLFKKELFEKICFPSGEIYEDVRIAYKLFYNAKIVSCINECKYNYRMRKGATTSSGNNRIDAFEALEECYQGLPALAGKENPKIKICIDAIFRNMANTAYYVLFMDSYSDDCKERLRPIEEFWRMNRHKIQQINIKFSIKVLAPHIFCFLIRLKKLIKT